MDPNFLVLKCIFYKYIQLETKYLFGRQEIPLFHYPYKMACNIFLVKFFPHTVCFKSPSHVINSKGFLAATLNIKGLKKTYRL